MTVVVFACFKSFIYRQGKFIFSRLFSKRKKKYKAVGST